MGTATLLADPDAAAREAQSTVAKVLEEAHQRFHQPLLCAVAALIGFATLLTGGFSQFSYWLLETFPSLATLG